MLPATPLDRTVRAGLKQIFRTYGIIGTVRQVSASVNNAVTGRSARTISDFTVKCVVTPVSGRTRFAYDLAYIAAAKNFTLGGQFRHEESIVLMDMKTMKNLIMDMKMSIKKKCIIWKRWMLMLMTYRG